MTPLPGPGITKFGSWPPTLEPPFGFGRPISPDPLALLVGAEHAGLTESALTASDTTVSVPMHGSTDSLNVSVSMAVLAYEALRQRTLTHHP